MGSSFLLCLLFLLVLVFVHVCRLILGNIQKVPQMHARGLVQDASKIRDAENQLVESQDVPALAV